MNVGIAWSGNKAHEQAHNRDVPLPHFLRLAEITGVTLHGLQQDEASKQLNEMACHGLIINRAPEWTNLKDGAAVVAEMDLIVCVDSALGHLAGAMGKPTWLLVNKRGADFRWARGEERTEWYEHHRLFWREIDEDWGAVMERVAKELKEVENGR